MSTTVYAWWKGNSVGHVSVSITTRKGKTRYISFWPAGDIQGKKRKKGTIGEIFGRQRSKMPKSYAEECSGKFIGRRADGAVTIYGLPWERTTKKKKLMERYKGESYSLAWHNCCDVACDCLSTLSGTKVFGVTPQEVFNEAQRLKSQFG